jgi:hypothetical protein
MNSRSLAWSAPAPARTAPAAPAPPPLVSSLPLYLRETLSVTPVALFFFGLKRCLKAGAALRTGLERVPAGSARRLTGHYLVYACFWLDTLVDALPDFARAHRVHQFVLDCLTRSRPLQALGREVLTCPQLSLGERVKTLLLLRGLDSLVGSVEAELGAPERVRFFREKMSSLISAVVEDVNPAAHARDTLDTLAPDYPAMGLSSLEVLWLLQGYPLEDIRSYRPLLGLAEQLARLEDDVLEVWKVLGLEEKEGALEGRVDRRNLILRHARRLRLPLRASLDEACRVAGLLDWRLRQELERLEGDALAPDLWRVLTFYPSWADRRIGPHRIPPAQREQTGA